MARSSTSFKPGQSGNPAGKPPKSRALTALLEAALDKPAKGPNGKSSPRKSLMAERVAEAVSTGFVTLPDEEGKNRRVPLTLADWRAFVQWLYVHVDGAKVLNEHTGADGADLIPKTIEIVNRTPDGS
jgi:hypothetical protein